MKRLWMVGIFLLLATGVAASEEPVGSIKTMEGTVVIDREGKQVTAEVGGRLYRQDLIRTQKESRVGIILRDDTVLSLGPESEMELKEYVFEPKQKQYGALFRMLKGTFIYLSGVIGKLSPDSVRLETPDSTIAIRGTRLMIEVEGH